MNRQYNKVVGARVRMCCVHVRVRVCCSSVHPSARIFVCKHRMHRVPDFKKRATVHYGALMEIPFYKTIKQNSVLVVKDDRNISKVIRTHTYTHTLNTYIHVLLLQKQCRECWDVFVCVCV